MRAKISASARRGAAARCPARSHALRLEPPTYTSANTFPGLIQHSSSLWFRTLSTNTSCRVSGTSVVPFDTEFAHKHDPLAWHTWNVIQFMRPSRSFIGTDCLPQCFQFVSTHRYQMGSPAWFDGDPLKVSWIAHVFICTDVHHVRTEWSHTKQLVFFLSVLLGFPLPFVAFACLREGIDLHVVWSSSVVKRHSRACLVLCVVLQELKSPCCHRFDSIHVLHLVCDPHR